MEPEILRGGQEEFKLVVHLGVLGLAVTCGLYNAGAWLSRREPHLLMNMGVYAGLVVWECHQIQRHMDKIALYGYGAST